jgi:hypothetical protein
LTSLKTTSPDWTLSTDRPCWRASNTDEAGGQSATRTLARRAARLPRYVEALLRPRTAHEPNDCRVRLGGAIERRRECPPALLIQCELRSLAQNRLGPFPSALDEELRTDWPTTAAKS